MVQSTVSTEPNRQEYTTQLCLSCTLTGRWNLTQTPSASLQPLSSVQPSEQTRTSIMVNGLQVPVAWPLLYQNMQKWLSICKFMIVGKKASKILAATLWLFATIFTFFFYFLFLIDALSESLWPWQRITTKRKRKLEMQEDLREYPLIQLLIYLELELLQRSENIEI